MHYYIPVNNRETITSRAIDAIVHCRHQTARAQGNDKEGEEQVRKQHDSYFPLVSPESDIPANQLYIFPLPPVTHWGRFGRGADF
jgi:hypothetical protein